MLKYNHLSKSTAKSRYSIPKATRFYRKVYSYCQSAFYDIPSSFGKRSAAFGKGTKSNFCKFNTQAYPGPSKYQKPSIWENNKRRGKGKIMAISRSQLPQTKSGQYPGPHEYKIPQKFQKESVKFSMRAKTTSKYTDRRMRAQPGPGKYQLPGQSQKGDYYWSKFRNSGARQFKRTARKDMNLNTCSPGPGQYNNEFQHLVRMSRVTNHRGFSVPRTIRNWHAPIKYQSEQVPGPGQYLHKGDFPDNMDDMRRTQQCLMARTKGTTKLPMSMRNQDSSSLMATMRDQTKQSLQQRQQARGSKSQRNRTKSSAKKQKVSTQKSSTKAQKSSTKVVKSQQQSSHVVTTTQEVVTTTTVVKEGNGEEVVTQQVTTTVV